MAAVGWDVDPHLDGLRYPAHLKGDGRDSTAIADGTEFGWGISFKQRLDVCCSDLMYRVGVGIALSPVSQQNAVRKAENYLDYTAFSCGGLINQLAYDGFTPAQAAYGTTAAGL